MALCYVTVRYVMLLKMLHLVNSRKIILREAYAEKLLPKLYNINKFVEC